MFDLFYHKYGSCNVKDVRKNVLLTEYNFSSGNIPKI